MFSRIPLSEFPSTVRVTGQNFIVHDKSKGIENAKCIVRIRPPYVKRNTAVFSG